MQEFGPWGVQLACGYSKHPEGDDPKLKGFTAWGILYKNETWLSQGSVTYLQQVKEIGDSYPKHCLSETRLNHCLYTVFSKLQSRLSHCL